MPAVHTRVLSVVLALAAAAAGANEEGGLRIGPKQAATAPREIPTEEFQAVIKSLTAPPAANAGNEPWEDSAQAATLAAQVHEGPELFTRLLIPPGFPRALPKASPEVRARAAAVLGKSGDLRALQALVDSAVYDPEDSVRRAAAKALRPLADPVAMRKLVDLAIARDYQKYPWPIRKSACMALRRLGDAAAMERIMRELSYELAGGNPLDPKNPPRGVAAGIGTDNGLAVPTGPPDLQLSEHDLYPVLSALKELTGMSFSKNEKDFKTWQLWWSKESAKFKLKE
ncbi:MAG: HEAT repeat domain-containing protein [Planctomycetota bacterium]